MARNKDQAKPAKYPKKFRQKLEKIARARDIREGIATHPKQYDEPINRGFPLLWHQFLPNGSVQVAHAVIDEEPFRLEMKLYLDTPRYHGRVMVTAPWLGETAASS